MEDNKLGQAEKIVDDMNKDLELSRIEELVKDNRISFDYKDKKYRVRLLNLAEKEELDLLRRRKFGQLMKDKDIFLEKDLIIQYKERGINIDELDDQLKKLNTEELDLQIKLGEAISKNEPETILKTYKEQIEEIRTKKQIINTQKTLLLEFSMENTLLNYVYQIICYLSLDEKKEGKWQRMFETLEAFQTYEDGQLINKAGSYSILLQNI
jgi:hypothetical protein